MRHFPLLMCLCTVGSIEMIFCGTLVKWTLGADYTRLMPRFSNFPRDRQGQSDLKFC